MSDITGLTLSQLVHGLRSGDFSSRETVQAYLAQIERLEPTLHAFLTLAAEQALAHADQADRQLAAWRKDEESHIPPLLGVPLAIKDVLCVAGLRCTAGSRILENFVPPFNATAVDRLLESGVIVLGKTNTDEFAMGSSTENSGYGPTHNPWNTERVPGGSSGGSAAAVAAYMAPAALGSDTGGSIRQPAAFCGISGIKPTYGRVSRYGLIAYGSSLDCVGSFARLVSDVALIYSLIAGQDEQDATSMDYPLAQANLDEVDLAGLRIGIPDEYFIAGIQPEVEAGVREAIKTLQSLGAGVERISLPHTEYALPVYYLIAPAEASANLARFDGIRYGPRSAAQNMWDIFRHTRGERFGAEVKRRIMLGTYALSAGYYDAYYGQAQKVRTLIKRDFEQAFEKVDVIAAPVAPTTAFPFGQHSDDPLAMYLEDIFTLPANLAGVPGLTFPVGFDTQGLPVGMQLMGPHFREDILFKAGHAYQQVTDWHNTMPPIVENSLNQK
ncbi:MAG: Asp-tRNA(Asn)/Glu-tRNA(Gln) amidotransferase subunit GatA [Anaerolineales bacterium]|nr:Asp-tRNA(Asn)/Glu-tRNA(Gln) amidotransferase subunit GatA [Anaerolineales bacterium]